MLKTAWRNMLRNRVYSFLNILGLAAGMGVALLIGLWVWDELSFNTVHQHYHKIARVTRHSTFNGEVRTRTSMPLPLLAELESRYSSEFEHIVVSVPSDEHGLAAGDKQIVRKGRFMGPGAPQMLSLTMLQGSASALEDPSSVLLSETVAKALFGNDAPMNKILQLDTLAVSVKGVYKDMPYNSQFSDLSFVAPWTLYTANNEWAKKAKDNWGINSYEIYVQLAAGRDAGAVSGKIRDIEKEHLGKDIAAARNPIVFLYPMEKWHLYPDWKNGVNTGGRMQFVWLFAIIGVFVLLLACINFMNIVTARSEKRAKEVGVRKAIGSSRAQLVMQFFSESLLLCVLALLGALLLAQCFMPLFNKIADKQMEIPLASPAFWFSTGVFCLATALLAGIYPALYLSSLRPVKALRGSFRSGRSAVAPRKALIVLQFAVSVTLIAGTLVVYQQLQYARNRPVGYSREGLVSVRVPDKSLQRQYEALRVDLLKSGAVADMAASQGPATDIWDFRSGFDWPGKEPGYQADFGTVAVTHDYGKTMGWEFIGGRDFSRDFPTDVSSGVILNESAAKFMNLPHPLGDVSISWAGEQLRVLGVVRDMVMLSPFENSRQTVFYLNYENVNHAQVRIHPGANAHSALQYIRKVFEKHYPAALFDYRFVDEEYALKFAREERIGTLSSCFAVLAVFICCLGLFGQALYLAEQRKKEIGIRKVLGASVFSVWKMLSKEFAVLVIVASCIAIPVTWYFLDRWLHQYQYHTSMRWWFFAMAGGGALVITLLTVSFQTVKSALANPAESLKSS